MGRVRNAGGVRQRRLKSGRMTVRRDLLAAREARVREDFHRQLLAEFPAAVYEMPAELEPAADTGGGQLLSASQ